MTDQEKKEFLDGYAERYPARGLAPYDYQYWKAYDEAEIPQYLYKYLPMTSEAYWDTLAAGDAWFSLAHPSLDVFEDIEDSILRYDVENITAFKNIERSDDKDKGDGCRRALSAMLEDAERFYSKSFASDENEPYVGYILKIIKQTFPKEKKYLEQGIQKIEAHLDEGERCVDVLKDTYHDCIALHLDNELKKTGIFSVIPDSQSEHMWESYAAGKTGICVMYETQNFPVPVFPIRYADEEQASYTKLFGAGELEFGTLEQNMYQRFFVKRTKYQDENEWRALADVQFCQSFPPEGIKGFRVPGFFPSKVIAGSRMPEENRARLQRLCDEKYIAYEQSRI